MHTELAKLREQQTLIQASADKARLEDEERQKRKVNMLVEAWLEDTKSVGAVPENEDVGGPGSNNAAQVLQVMQCASKKRIQEVAGLQGQIKALKDRHLEEQGPPPRRALLRHDQSS